MIAESTRFERATSRKIILIIVKLLGQRKFKRNGKLNFFSHFSLFFPQSNDLSASNIKVHKEHMNLKKRG